MSIFYGLATRTLYLKKGHVMAIFPVLGKLTHMGPRFGTSYSAIFHFSVMPVFVGGIRLTRQKVFLHPTAAPGVN